MPGDGLALRGSALRGTCSSLVHCKLIDSPTHMSAAASSLKKNVDFCNAAGTIISSDGISCPQKASRMNKVEQILTNKLCSDSKLIAAIAENFWGQAAACVLTFCLWI